MTRTFLRGSRYEKVAEAEWVDAEGRPVRHKRLRLLPTLPPPTRLGHEVRVAERLDHVAHRHYAEPERYWALCDANEAMWPDDLTAEPGRILRVPPKEG